MAASDPRRLAPQQGPQAIALSSPADILIFGGAAGSGKSFGLSLEATRHIHVPGFGCEIFRRTYPRITQTGGLWDTSKTIYPLLGGVPTESKLLWTFPSGATIRFRHLEYEKNLEDIQGSQICLIGCDEVTELTERMFWFLLSRNRSTCGVKPYVRATCNPDAESWLAPLVAWWIDPDTGYPIPERAGRLRWFVRDDDKIYWANRRETLLEKHPRNLPKSFTFVPSTLDDNPALDQTDPGYRANLLALPYVERMRFLGGNWHVRPAAGFLFPRDKWQYTEAETFRAMRHRLRYVRAWDKAGTEGGQGARSAGVLVASPIGSDTGPFYLVHADAGRWGDLEREGRMKSWAISDRAQFGDVQIVVEQEPGSGGKDSALATARNLAGFSVHLERPRDDKPSRWRPFAAQVQAANVFIVQGDWDWVGFVRELDALAGDPATDKSRLKDLADAASDGFNFLVRTNTMGVVHGELLHDDGADTDYDAWSDEDKAAMPEFLREIVESVDLDDRGTGRGRYRGGRGDDDW